MTKPSDPECSNQKRSLYEQAERVIRQRLGDGNLLRRTGQLETEERCLFLLHEEEILRAVCELKAAFPSTCLHTYALKANPLPYVVRTMISHGLGIECATIEEVHHASSLGCPMSKIVFDSPCKTETEIGWCFERGIHLLNVDNLDELERVAQTVKKWPSSPTLVGLRINPQIGAGTLTALSTATKCSKFGIPLKETDLSRLVDVCRSLERIKALHVHVGSGGMRLDQLTEGATAIVKLARAINTHLGRSQIDRLDFGGGFPEPRDPADTSCSFYQLWDGLVTACGADDLKHFTVITEFGLGLVQRAGIVLSRVEYVKHIGGHQVAVVHCGADMFTEGVYSTCSLTLDQIKQQDLSLLRLEPRFLAGDGSRFRDPLARRDSQVSRDEREPSCLDIVGPLCFSGDVLCRNLDFVVPTLQPEDVILFPMVGAYTISCWMKMTSRRVPPVYVLTSSNGELRCVKPFQSFTQAVGFWD